MNFDVQSRTIYHVAHGSRAYGTNTPDSDYDYRGVCIPPKEYYLGFLQHFEQQEYKNELALGVDRVVYALKKFVFLAVDCNPNALELLFVDSSSIVNIDKYGEELLENRDMFVSKLARHRFAGYAHAQLKKIKTHKAWLLNPPTHKPTREEFELDETQKVSKSTLGAFDAVIEQGAEVDIAPNIMLLYTREKRYQTAMQHWENYEKWKKERNPKRAVLEGKFSYDTKHGMHLVRLGRMCIEILEGKGVIVKRPDAEELLAIRDGAWSYEKIVEYAENLDKRAGELYVTSKLRKEPDRVAIDKLIVSITERYLSEHG